MVTIVAYFQADSVIGLGHCVRVRALINALSFDIRLVVAADGVFVNDYFQDAEVRPHCDILKIIDDECRSGLVVLISDHPQAQENLGSFTHPDLIHVAIDDLGSDRLRSDVLVNCSGLPDYHRYPAMQGGVLLLGLEYLPISPVFSWRGESASKRGCLGIMVGSSQLATDWICRLLRMDFSTVCDPQSIRIVISPSTPGGVEIQQIGAARGIDVQSRLSPAEVAFFFQECRLCIMTAGMALYEAFSCGVPVIAFPIQKDMQPECAYYHSLGMLFNVTDGMSEPDLVGVTRRLWNDSLTLERMSALARERVDGRGLLRISSVISSAVNCYFDRKTKLSV
jgi:spore coat polysaccharide biosynthesis predicted glycosyltransferase SpsG